jgi:lipoprotein-releasing system permease protein
VLYGLKIAARYLTANRGQTLLLVLGVAVGVFVFVFMSALIGGLAELLISRTVGNIAHVTVEPTDGDPVSLSGTDPSKLVAVLKSTQQRSAIHAAAAFLPIIGATPHVTVVTEEILGSGFLTKGEAVAPVAVTGVDPDQVSAIADIAGNLVAGTTDLTLTTILIGKGLADTLGLQAGQTVSLKSDRNVEQTLRVGGIFALGIAALDDSAAYVNIRAARTLFDLPEGISRFEIKLDDLQRAPEVAAALAADTGLEATPWTAKNQQLLDGLVAQARSGDLIKAFALITIVIGIASALLLSTYRRQPEIGIMRAMGATRRFVVLVFVIQGALIGLTGGLLGAGLGYAALLPFPVPEQTASGGLPIDIRLGAYGTAILLTLIGAVLASIWPASAASRVDPVTVIGS